MKQKFIKLALMSLVSTLLFFPKVFAALGAVSTATGGTGRGAVEPVDGILLNPATISDLPQKNFSINYSVDHWGLTVADNGEEAYIPAAFKFITSKTDRLETQELGLSVASWRKKKIALGGSLTMVEYTDRPSSSIEQKYRQTTLDLAATYAFAPNLGLGFVANKVGATEIDLEDSSQVQQIMALGLAYTYQNFARIRFDVESAPHYKTERLVYMLGLENYLNDWMVFRFGYKNNNVEAQNYFTAGVGFSGPQFGIHYAYISTLGDKTEEKHLIDLGIPF